MSAIASSEQSGTFDPLTRNVGPNLGRRDYEYWLAPYVNACRTADGTILLDLMKDEYLGVGPAESDGLVPLVDGWPAFGTGDASAIAPPETCRNTAEELLRVGVLCRGVQREPAVRSGHADLTGTLTSIGDEINHEARVRPAHLWSFLRSYASARIGLKALSLYRISQSVRQRKERALAERVPFDVSKASALIEVFRQLRPFFLRADGQCLLHALALVNFLSLYDLYPAWVIGVKARPWAAHSWVQQDHYILDSTPEKICHYTPILTV